GRWLVEPDRLEPDLAVELPDATTRQRGQASGPGVVLAEQDPAVDRRANTEGDRRRDVRLDLARHRLRVWALGRDDDVEPCRPPERAYRRHRGKGCLSAPFLLSAARLDSAQFSHLIDHDQDVWQVPATAGGIPASDALCTQAIKSRLPLVELGEQHLHQL